MFSPGGEGGGGPAVEPSLLEALSDPDGTAYLLATHPPTPAATAVAAHVPLGGLSAAGRVDLLRALEAQIAWLTARQLRLLAVMDAAAHAEQARAGAGGDVAARNWLREDVGSALRVAPRTAADRIDTATGLVTYLPDTVQLLGAGRIGYRHAVALADAVSHLDRELITAVETRVLDRAGAQTVGEFRTAVHRAVLTADPASAEQRHVTAVQTRNVRAWPAEDGMTDLHALLPAAGAAVVMEAIHTLAGVTSAADSRTADQRRADALVALAAAVLHDPHAPRAHGLRPHIQLTVAASTLLGVDEQPAELAGYGPVTAAAARHLAGDPTGTWRRILTDPASGALLDYGTRTYRPPPPLTRHVLARDRECVFPHCHRRAERCDLDHLTRWADGGPTNPENLAPLCPRHHRAKDDHHWTVHRHPDTGHYQWTSPTGHTYTKTIPPYHHPPQPAEPAEPTADQHPPTSSGEPAETGYGRPGDELSHDEPALDEPRNDEPGNDEPGHDEPDQTISGDPDPPPF